MYILPTSCEKLCSYFERQAYFFSLFILRLAFGSTQKTARKGKPCRSQPRKILFFLKRTKKGKFSFIEKKKKNLSLERKKKKNFLIIFIEKWKKKIFLFGKKKGKFSVLLCKSILKPLWYVINLMSMWLL
jgi:hypothetical protein